MATIVTKYSDYVIQSIEYFITQIEAELTYRDIRGLTNNNIEKISVLKQHPLVMIIDFILNPDHNKDPLSSGLLPVISVTPGNLTDEAFTLANSYNSESIDDDFIDRLKYFHDLSLKDIHSDVLISKTQIETILERYKHAAKLLCQTNEYHKNEEINISIWSESADYDILLGNIMDSILAGIQTGFAGDGSQIQKMQFRTTKGLTNFNFGKVLFGTEYLLTFLNTFNNYIIYEEDVISDHTFEGTFTTVDEEDS